MIPVVVGDDEVIDFGNVIDGIDISPFERAHEPPNRQSVGQYRVEEEAHTTRLEIDRGVTEPDANIFRAGNVLQRRLCCWYIAVRTQILHLAKQKLIHLTEEPLITRQRRCLMHVDKLTIAPLRRLFAPLQPFSTRLTAYRHPELVTLPA